MLSAHGLLGGHAYFLHWGVVQISLANFIVIALMIVIFVLALVLPFPHGRQRDETRSEHDVRD
jgi:large-conductance mechanosensitive channel